MKLSIIILETKKNDQYKKVIVNKNLQKISLMCMCTILSALKSLVKRMIDDAQNCITAKNYFEQIFPTI